MTSSLITIDHRRIPRGVYRGGWTGHTVEFEWGDGSRLAQSQEQREGERIPCWVCSDGMDVYVTDDPAQIKR